MNRYHLQILGVTKIEEAIEKQSKTSRGRTELPETPYLKALTLRKLQDVDAIKGELKLGNVLILRITPLAIDSVKDVKEAVNELIEFARSIGGDIARLGEERIVIVPSFMKIWRAQTI